MREEERQEMGNSIGDPWTNEGSRGRQTLK